MIFEKYILIACASINVTLIAYFFYWNRIIAFLLTRILRFLFWNQDGSSLWIDIGSFDSCRSTHARGISRNDTDASQAPYISPS